MTTWTSPRAAWFGIAFSFILAPLVSEAQQVDLDAAAEAKAAAGREALSHPVPHLPGPRAIGTFVTFDAPGAVNGTNPASINPAGAIAGSYVDASNVLHGYVRAPGGAITTFDAPGAGTGLFQGTSPLSINAPGAIVGDTLDASNVYHGFLRARDGTITTFDAPGASTGSFEGTIPFSNNPVGMITGYYTDSSGVFHGFLRIP